MKCQNCGKNNANVRYMQVINGDKMELILCENCANEMNIGMNFNFGINDVFSSFFDDFAGFKTVAMPEITKCKTCGLTYDEFSKSGMLGCENCYTTFGERLDNVLKRLHGSNRQLASKKIDKKGKKNEKLEIDKLKDELKICIEKEEYEKAAILRDKIKKLEK